MAVIGLPALPAAAHGAVSDPIARHYGCYVRWPNGPSAQMQAEDPMCYMAWQANPGAMYNWNGLLKDGVNGAHQTAVPDGQLCSGGMAQNGRYAAFDEPGQWLAANKPNRFTLNLNDTSSHGADYIRVYVTRQGFDPLTQRPRWSDLELVTETGRMPTGTTTPVEVNAPGRTGRHIVYTVWQASHLDQSYYFCSDVNFGGTTTGPTTPPTTRPTTPPTTRPTTPPSTPPTTRPTTPATTPTANPPGGCAATYRIVGQWGGGFQGEVTVTNTGTTATTGWTVGWTFPNGQTISQIWGGVNAANGTAVAVRNVGWNGVLAPNATTTFGFLGNWNGTNSVPAPITCTRA